MSKCYSPQIAVLTLGFSLIGVAACGGDKDGDSPNASGSSSTAGSSNSSAGSNAGGTNSGSGGSDSSAGSSSNPGGGFSTSLPGNKPLGTLSDSEAEQLCEDLGEFIDSSDIVDSTQEFSCRLSGILAAVTAQADTDAAARAACKAGYEACLAAPPETVNEECTKPSAECTATVDEMEACMNDASGFLAEATAAFPECDSLVLDDLGSGEGALPMSPTSCETFETKCPDGPALPGTDMAP